MTAVFSSVPSQIETDAVIRDAVDAAGVLLRRQLERCKTQQPLKMYRAVFSRCVAWLEMYELARAISSRFESDCSAMPLEPTPTVRAVHCCILNKPMLQGHKLSGSAA